MPYGMTGSNYAAGDYYQGDYYQGDPGILGSIGKAIGKAAKFVGSLAPGPAGALLKGVGTALVPTSRGPFSGVTGGASSTAPAPMLPALPPLDQYGIINISSGEKGGGGGGKLAPIGIPAMRGLHYNKSTYETRGGGTSRWGPSGNLQLHPAGTVLVRSRRMNVGNARALKRALRRARGFERLARSVMVVHRFKKKATKRKR